MTHELKCDNLHRHVHAALLRAPRQLGVRLQLVRLGVGHIWPAHERPEERVEYQVGADPARRERLTLVEGEVCAGIRRIEQVRDQLRCTLGDAS